MYLINKLHYIILNLGNLLIIVSMTEGRGEMYIFPGLAS